MGNKEAIKTHSAYYIATSTVETEMGMSLKEAFYREKDAFLRMFEGLLKNPRYNRKFVAVFKGKVVDYDTDNRTLAKRVYAKFGYVPIYIDKVSEEKRVVEVNGKKLEFEITDP